LYKFNGIYIYIYRRGEACKGVWRGNLRERDHWGDPGVDGSIILIWILKK
jgi:hypothetical protein